MRREHIASPRSPPVRGLATDSGRRPGIQFYGGRSVQKGELEFKPMFNKKNIAKLLVFAMILTMLPVSVGAGPASRTTNQNKAKEFTNDYVTVSDVYATNADVNAEYQLTCDADTRQVENTKENPYNFSYDAMVGVDITKVSIKVAAVEGKEILDVYVLTSDTENAKEKISVSNGVYSYNIAGDTDAVMFCIETKAKENQQDNTATESDKTYVKVAVPQKTAGETETVYKVAPDTASNKDYVNVNDTTDLKFKILSGTRPKNSSQTVSYSVTKDVEVEFTSSDPSKASIETTGNITTSDESGYVTVRVKGVAKADSVTITAKVKGHTGYFGSTSIEVKEKAEEYTVTFDANGGKFLDNTTANKQVETVNQKIASLPTVTKDNFTFAGWVVKDSEEAFTSDYEVKADMTVCAKWTEDTQKPEEYTVTFDANGGTFDNGEESVEVATVNQKVTLPTAPTLDGKVFVEWNTAQDGNGAKFDGTDEVTENMTVYAKWRDLADDEYMIAVDVKPAGAGTVTTDPSQAAKAGVTVKVTATPASASYELKSLKWAYTIDKDTTYDIDMDTKEFTMPNDHVTVFAQFGRVASAGTHTVRTEVDPTNSGTIIVTSGETLFVKGDTVEFTVRAASNYRLAADSVVYKIDDDTNVDYGKAFTPRYNASNDVYSFTMPDANVVITAVFEKIPSDDKIVAVNMDISGEWFSGYALPEATTTTEGVKLTTVWTDKDGNVQNIAFDDVEVETEFTYTITVEAEEGYELGNYKCEFSGIDALTGKVNVKPRAIKTVWAPTANEAGGDLVVTGTSAKKFYIIEEKGTSGSASASVYLIMQGGEKGELLVPCNGELEVKMSEVDSRNSAMTSGKWIIENSTIAASLDHVAPREDVMDDTGSEVSTTVKARWTVGDGNEAGGDLVVTGTSAKKFYIIEEKGTSGSASASVYLIMQGVEKADLLIPCNGELEVKMSEVDSRNSAMTSGKWIIENSTVAATIH